MKRQEPKVYLTPEQLELIDRVAERLDISRSQFMRQAAVEKAMRLESEDGVLVSTDGVRFV